MSLRLGPAPILVVSLPSPAAGEDVDTGQLADETETTETTPPATATQRVHRRLSRCMSF
jgi:hypothetical protein